MFAGALDLTQKAIEAELSPEADIHQPTFELQPETSFWVLSGIAFYKDTKTSSARTPFVAVLEGLCPEAADASCWRMVEFEIDGEAASISENQDTAQASLALTETKAQASKPEALNQSSELADTQDPNSSGMDTADVQPNVAPYELALVAQSASANAVLLQRDLSIAQQRIVELVAEAFSLSEQLAETRKDHTKALEGVRAEAEAKSQERVAKAEAAATKAKADLAEALDRIAQLKASPQSLDTKAAQSAEEPQQSQPQQEASIKLASVPAEAVSSTPAIPESGKPVNLLGGDANWQMVAALPEPNTALESIVDIDSLIANPTNFQERDIVVTGDIMWLLQDYHLKSTSGHRSLVVDVARISTAKRTSLEEAIEVAGLVGLVGLVGVRVRGTVDKGSSALYRIIASDVTVIE